MTRFDDYTDAVRGGASLFDWKYEVVAPDGVTLASTDRGVSPVDMRASVSPMSFSHDSISERSADMLVLADSSVLRTGTPDSILHPDAGSSVRVSAGVYSEETDQWVWWQKALVIPDYADGILTAGVHESAVHLVDSVRYIRDNLTTTWAWDRGTPVEEVVAGLIGEVFQGATVATTGFTLPAGSLLPGTSRYKAIVELLESCGHELVVDSGGAVSTRQILNPDDVPSDPRWRYGVNGLPIDETKRRYNPRSPQGWLIKGGGLRSSTTSIDLVMWDTDPRSEGFYQGGGGAPIGESGAPYAERTSQIAAAGYGQLRRHGSGPGVVTFKALPNPAMEVHDLIDIEAGDVIGPYRVLAIDLPLELDGLMTVTARGCYDPALFFDDPIDVTEGYATQFDDNFDRPDENLEDAAGRGGEAGSPDWTENGYSWAVIAGRAIQRYQAQGPYPDGWSLGYANTPMASVNQTVTTEIHAIPSGRWAGPASRTTGQFECYAALMDSNGRLSLEFWQAGRRVQVLDTHDTGRSPSNVSVTLQALGSRLTVRAGSDDLIDVTDNRLLGRHVGMLGYGGYGSAAPAVESFSATAVGVT